MNALSWQDGAQVLAVELPFFRTTASLFDCFEGGRYSVEEAGRSGEYKVSLAAHDPLRQYIVGKSAEACSIVVKRRRLSLVGMNSESVKFGESDFQFLPELVDIGVKTCVGSSVIEAVPRPFVKPVIGVGVGISDLWANDARDDEHAQEGEEEDEDDVTLLIKWGDVVPPEKNPFESGSFNDGDKKRAELCVVLKRYFLKKAMWRKRELELECGAAFGQAMLNEVFPHVAFNYVTGPFKGLWIRLGFDAATNPNSRHYQMVVIRFNTELFRKLNEKIASHMGRSNVGKCVADLDNMTLDVLPAHVASGAGIKTMPTFRVFKTLAKEMVYFQVCNISDDEVLKFVSTAKHCLECDSLDGWYSDTTMRYLRARIIQAICDRVEQFISRPVVLASSVVASEPEDLFSWHDKYLALPSDHVAHTSQELKRNEDELYELIHSSFREFVIAAPPKKIKKRAISAAAAAVTETSAAASEMRQLQALQQLQNVDAFQVEYEDEDEDGD
jgi:hypothetical protein